MNIDSVDFKTDVVVVGAGGGGAVLGLALAKKGIKAMVLEQASGPPQGIRGEILQPNGQQVLETLGLFTQLPAEAVRPVRYFHFCQVGGQRLCTVDYDMLSPPYNRALVVWPNVVHKMVLQELEAQNTNGVQYEATFQRLLYHDSQVVGVEAEVRGGKVRIGAKLVVGADGPFSQVREALRIPASLYRYKEGYLISMLECPEGLDESQYFVGKKKIMGIFPAAGNHVYVFFMIRGDALPRIKAKGLLALREEWKAIYPDLEKTFSTLVSWDQTAYMGTGRVRASTWVHDGAVLIGDAAHGMNPHASQGRMQAMVDALTLAAVIESCMEKGDWSAAALYPFESKRRPHVTMLQRLADEEVFFWNTGNPLLCLFAGSSLFHLK